MTATDDKKVYNTTESSKSGINGDDILVQHGNSAQDALDMRRLGKKQEFRRNFGFLSTLGFISIYTATWEFVLVSLSAALTSGGFGGLFWTFLVTTVLYSSIVASLAEMESMAPTSGGQYHWVSEFAPPSYQRILSYAAGWMSSLGWLASMASSVFICTTLLEVLIEIKDTNFGFTNWQYTLIMLVVTAITIIFNTYLAKILPAVETISLFGHILGFIVTLVPLWVMCPHNSAHDVFFTLVNSSGWNNTTAILIGQVSIVYSILGSDSVVHISEEIEDASLTVPRVMWWSYIINTALAIIMLITMLFCLGPIEDALAASTPYLQLFQNTGSTAVAYVLTVILFVLIFSGNITCLATTSREIWAFSRDRGFPFSKWICKMDRKRQMPFNSVYLTSIFTAILCLINLGSSFAFNIIISLNLLALLSVYMISIGCVMLKRLRREPLPPARWSLGSMGLVVNAFAFVYCAFIIIFCCFPASFPVDLSSANWGPLVWGGVFIASLVIYIIHGRKHFTAPVIFVEGRGEDRIQGTC